MSLAKDAAQGLAWTTAARSFAQLVGVGVTLALARLLTPEDFGLIAMVTVVTGFLSVFGEMGFAEALVQRPELEERHRSTVFWLNLLTGLALAGALVLAAPYLARFYDDDRLIWLVRALALNFVLAPLAMVQRATLLRELRFRVLALAESAGVLLASGVAIGLALFDHGVWALVGHALATTLGGVIVLWALSSWRPRAIWSRAALGDLWSYGSHLVGYGAIAYWARQVDDLLIGRVLGPVRLGLYGRAYSTMNMPVTEVGSVLTRVMFPTFAKLQHEPAKTKEIYLGLVSVLGFVTFPVMFGLAALADVFIRVLYGEQWLGATSVLRIYALVGCSLAIGSTTSWIFKSQGRTDLMFRWGVVASALTIAGIVAGISFGSIEAVAIGYGVTHVFVLSYHRYRIPGALIGVLPREVLASVAGALGCAAVMAFAVFALGLWLSPRVPAFADLGVRTLLGLILYLVLAKNLRVHGYVQTLKTLRGRLLEEPPPAEPS